MLRPAGLALSILALPVGVVAQEEPEAKERPSPPAAEALDTVAAPQALKARSIGPAVMGGRVSDIAFDPTDPYTFYVGLGTGGVMQTSDNGGTFKGVFEKEAVAAIGAIAVAPSDPGVVWVGTGEANDRNSSGWGYGVYLSTDSATTWRNVGLHDSKAIARIVVHPTEPRTAWVAAMGDLWSSGGERGLYRTTDGGKTWKAVLTAGGRYRDLVGCGDVVLDPSNPTVVYAALYARRRRPWAFEYGPSLTGGEDVGGIFKSTDGGGSWTKLTGGLPTGTGRIGLAIFRNNPRIVYAVVQSDAGGTQGIDDLHSKNGGVFRSEDGGEHWTRMSDLDPRPFYFSQIRVDPKNDKRVYLLGYMLHVSEDGGRSFREDLFQKVHSDNHALAIDPRDPKRMLLGTDGGVYQTVNAGERWAHLNRMAAGEYYRINLDLATPYRICGGLQDNVNWVGPSMTRSKEGILNSDWINIGGGDGFYCVFDPADPMVVYAESQQGYLHRMNLTNGEIKRLRPEPTEGQIAFRFHWNSPLIGSRHARGAMYLAGNRVFRLKAQGEQWETISPDLSTRDVERTTAVGSGAENYGVVYTLAESPLQAGLLWAGTDDGKVWVTENDGGKWADLSARIPKPARGEWVSRIEPGSHDPRVAYLAVDAHRDGNYAPLIFRTGDLGRSWKDISANLPKDGPAKVIREDPKNPNLLYLGTEFGLYASLNGGRRWFKFGDLPTVAVDDILVHPREMDLVIATHGRSLYIVDDVAPLQQFTSEVAAMDAHLFPPRLAHGFYPLPGFVENNGAAVFRGDNPPDGALLSFYVRRYTSEPLKLAIKDAAGHPVANLTAPATPGINRVNWDLKPTKDLLTEYGGLGADKFVPSGEYTVTLTYGKLKQSQKLQVDIAPGIETR
jgi:photosystem II stability/assembly factor-like uncharacterized protein